MNSIIKQQMALSPQDIIAKRSRSEQLHVFYHAPTVIIVSGSKEEHSPFPLAGTDISYTPLVDCAAAIQNMLLAAESLTIGSCWLGVVNYFFTLPHEIVKLGIPQNYQPFFAVTLGYKDPAVLELTAAQRRKNVISYTSST